MFGRKNKTQATIATLQTRLVELAKKVEENNHEIAELKGAEKRSGVAFKALADKVGELRTRQNALRTALSDAMKNHD